MTNGLTPGGPRRYRSYLLRVWEVENDGMSLWRASLQDSHTGERHGFADLTAMAAFLSEQTGDQSGLSASIDPPGPDVS